VDGDPVAETLTREALVEISQALHRLPSDFREALLLRVTEDYSFREIAEILDITEETARWRVFKARQKLKQILDPDLQPPASPRSGRKKS
jgi:RNA polymerase sigma-70 factor (ECF subfamily)